MTSGHQVRITTPAIYPTLAVYPTLAIYPALTIYPTLLAVPTACHATPQTIGSFSAHVQCWDPTICINGSDRNEGWVTLPSVSMYIHVQGPALKGEILTIKGNARTLQ